MTHSLYRKMVGSAFFILSIIYYHYAGRIDKAILLALYAIFTLLLDMSGDK